MEKLYLTHGKTLSIYHHRNNCGENVHGKIVDCQRKNICIVLINTRNGKIGVGQVAVKGAVTSPPPKFTGVLDCLKAARIIENICRIERHLWRSFFCVDNCGGYMYMENLAHVPRIDDKM